MGSNVVPSIDGCDVFLSVYSRDKEFGLMVGLGDEAVDGTLELDQRAEDAALEAAPGEICGVQLVSRRFTSY
jgi:hypothetical protein